MWTLWLACGQTAEECGASAEALLRSDPTHPDLVRALGCACDGGLGESCNALGAALAGGRGVERDPDAAHQAFERGCAAPTPSARACSNAGNDLFTGRLGRQDFPAAAERFDRGCRLGDAPSCEQARAARDPAGAARRFSQGCALGDASACLNLAVVLPPGDAERTRLLHLTCSAGIDAACMLQ